MEVNWDNEATAMANYVDKKMPWVHRGAMPWRQVGISVVFGNDCYSTDERARDEVAWVRDRLGELGIKVLGFGPSRVERGSELWESFKADAADPKDNPDGLGPEEYAASFDGISWAMLVESPDTEALKRIVWQGWNFGCEKKEAREGKPCPAGLARAFADCQGAVADQAIAESGIRPDHSAN
jgi:hypothetical protein